MMRFSMGQKKIRLSTLVPQMLNISLITNNVCKRKEFMAASKYLNNANKAQGGV